MDEPEPWLRGGLGQIPAHIRPVFFSFQQVREDLRRACGEFDDRKLWTEMAGHHSLGFHLKHMAGSIDRLTAYLMNLALTEEQLMFLRDERTPGVSARSLLDLLDSQMQATERQIMQIPADALPDQRQVGRQQLPTTVIGLLVHLCEHTQRHLG